MYKKKDNKNYVILNKNFKFQQVYRRGQSFVSPVVVSYILPKQRGQIRFGISASKKIGCAVERNRARRVIKAALYDLLPKITGSYDLVFVARRATTTTKSTILYSVLYEHLKRAGVIEQVND
jgi:ribonuclease P protein component